MSGTLVCVLPVVPRLVRAAAAAAVAAAAVGAASAGATTAAAAPASLTVSGAAGTVTISLDPFRLAVRDARGRVALAEVPNPSAPPTPYVSEAPPAGGSTTGRTPPLYAPLTVLVGTAVDAPYPGTPWEGNLVAGGAAGVQYSAQKVLSHVAVPGGMRLTVSTNDPTGLTLDITVTEAARHVVVDVTTAGVLPRGASALVGDAFTSPAGEAFHGFGGRHDGIDHHGQAFETYVQEEDFGAGPLASGQAAVPGTGGSTYLFPDGPSAAYYVQPQFISSAGYGFALDQSQIASWRLDSDRSDAWTVQAAAPHLRYVVATGGETQATAELTSIYGRQPVPPMWGLGPQLDRLTYTGTSAATYYSELLTDIATIRRDRLPLTGYRIEGWALLTAAQLHTVISALHAQGIHALLYFRSYDAVDGGDTEQPSSFTDALQHGYFTTTAAGTPYLYGSPFIVGVAGTVDLTKPAAAAWFAHRIQAGLDAGADGFMADFGEQVLPDMHFANGQTGATMHNEYPVVYARTVRAAVTAWERTHPGRQVFWYSRAGYSGSARYESASFPGDETTDWSVSSGLASLAPDMLNRAIGGDYGYDTDIGGYEDATTGATGKELFLRWAEWAALSPTFRDHGSAESGTHTPWSYDAQTLAAYESLTRLHEAAEPLIARLWAAADRTGVPPTEPLWLAYPGDATAAAQDEEWLLGPDVLVTPVVTQGATTRTAYLPAGCWTYEPTGAHYSGHRSVTVAAPLTTLAFFVRCGTRPFVVPASATASAHATSSTSEARAAGAGLAATGLDPRVPLAGLAALGLAIASASWRRRTRT